MFDHKLYSQEIRGVTLTLVCNELKSHNNSIIYKLKSTGGGLLLSQQKYVFLWVTEVRQMCLTQWGRLAHICVGKLTNIGSNNGSSPAQRQAIIWTNAEILLIGPSGTTFSDILVKIHPFSFQKRHLKLSSVKRRTFCLGLNVLK